MLIQHSRSFSGIDLRLREDILLVGSPLACIKYSQYFGSEPHRIATRVMRAIDPCNKKKSASNNSDSKDSKSSTNTISEVFPTKTISQAKEPDQTLS